MPWLDALSGKQQQALMALMAKPTISAAAEAAGLGESTLRAWLADATFHTAYMEARRQAMSHAVAMLQQASAMAVVTLYEVMTDKDNAASTRANAAKTVLEMAMRGLELESVIAEVEQLKQLVNVNLN
jgi:hypothetical protein